MTMAVNLPEDTKETLLNVLQRAASQDRAVIEFSKDDGEMFAADITDHVDRLEDDL